MTTERTIPEDAIDHIKIKDYNFEDRATEDNIEVIIHLNEDRDVLQHLEHNVIMIKAGLFEAASLQKFVENKE